jgi:hypothetical protein
VNASSQDITEVVRNTQNAIQSIGIIAQNTESKAKVTREQVQNMSELAQVLLKSVEFFRLNQSTPAKLIQSAATPSPAADIQPEIEAYQLFQHPQLIISDRLKS